MNDHCIKGEEMKGVLVIMVVLVFASVGMAGEYFKWVDERGVVHFTDIEAKVPEGYREDVERRRMPVEREAPSESPREERKVTEEPRDRYGRGRDYWVKRTDVAKRNLYRAQSEYEQLRREYRDLLDAYDRTTSLAKRDEYKKRMESVQNEMRIRNEDILTAREMLERTLPAEAARAGAPPEWVR